MPLSFSRSSGPSTSTSGRVAGARSSSRPRLALRPCPVVESLRGDRNATRGRHAVGSLLPAVAAARVLRRPARLPRAPRVGSRSGNLLLSPSPRGPQRDRNHRWRRLRVDRKIIPPACESPDRNAPKRTGPLRVSNNGHLGRSNPLVPRAHFLAYATSPQGPWGLNGTFGWYAHAEIHPICLERSVVSGWSGSWSRR